MIDEKRGMLFKTDSPQKIRLRTFPLESVREYVANVRMFRDRICGNRLYLWFMPFYVLWIESLIYDITLCNVARVYIALAIYRGDSSPKNSRKTPYSSAVSAIHFHALWSFTLGLVPLSRSVVRQSAVVHRKSIMYLHIYIHIFIHMCVCVWVSHGTQNTDSNQNEGLMEDIILRAQILKYAWKSTSEWGKTRDTAQHGCG